MKTLSELKTQAYNLQIQNRISWLDNVKDIAREVMLFTPIKDICIRFIPEARWKSGTVVNGTLLIHGEWRELFGDNYAELTKEMLEGDSFFEGWLVDVGKYMDMQYLVVTEIGRS